jgi:ribosomal protein S18 acetylase RimI-like enzyme
MYSNFRQRHKDGDGMIRKRNTYLDDRAILDLIRRELIPLNPPEFQTGDFSDKKLLSRLARGTTYVWSDRQRRPALAFITMIPTGSTLFIDLLAVNRRRRGAGIGGALLLYAQKYGRERGCRRMQLHVNDTNDKGIRFYLKNGMGIVRHDTFLRSYLMEKTI